MDILEIEEIETLVMDHCVQQNSLINLTIGSLINVRHK